LKAERRRIGLQAAPLFCAAREPPKSRQQAAKAGRFCYLTIAGGWFNIGMKRKRNRSVHLTVYGAWHA
jgi:hypothetical protein